MRPALPVVSNDRPATVRGHDAEPGGRRLEPTGSPASHHEEEART
jgi:hypothetical protein